MGKIVGKKTVYRGQYNVEKMIEDTFIPRFVREVEGGAKSMQESVSIVAKQSEREDALLFNLSHSKSKEFKNVESAVSYSRTRKMYGGLQLEGRTRKWTPKPGRTVPREEVVECSQLDMFRD